MKNKLLILSCILLGSFNAFAATGTPVATPTVDCKITGACGTAAPTATATPVATQTPTPAATQTAVATSTVDCKITGACATIAPTATPIATQTAIATATPIVTSTPVTSECADGKDNDNDGKIDSEDPDCQNGGTTENGTGPTVTLVPECSDGIDNDGDGFTDFPADPNCESATDNTESDTGVPTANLCYDVSAQNVEAALNKEAVQLTKLAHKAVKRVAATAANAKLKTQLARSLKRADKLKDAVYKTLLEDPSVFTVCQQLCVSVDNFFKIKLLGGLQNELRGLTKRLIARTYFNSLGVTKKNDPLVLESKKIQLRGKAGLDQLNAFLTQCGQGALS